MIVVLIFFLKNQSFSINKRRLFLILFIIFTATYGFLMAKYNGANQAYSVKFATPLLVLAAFLSIRNYREIFIKHHRLIIIVSSTFSMIAMLIVRLELDNINTLLLRGWSVTFSQNRGISAWHYFALSLSAFYIYARIFQKILISRTMIVLCFFQLISLLLMNGTGAFIMANSALLILVLPFKRLLTLPTFLLFYIVVIMTTDYFTFQYLTNAAVDLMRFTLAEDRGDLIRLIQIQYFIENVQFFGHGFGSVLHFDFSEIPDRTAQHQRFPYASEVVFLNYVHGGGVFVGFILLFFCRNILYCLYYFFAGKNKLDAFLGFVCSLVLIGSISNPFLLSPISVLLLAISYDSFTRLNNNKFLAKSD
jgi:hypothetical protein